MKKLNITWAGVEDPTGYLFSFAKSLSAAVKNSPYSDMCEDIVATSGFAFRIWAAADLCPSAMSIWQFNKQKPWVESGGLTCDYVERLWGQESVDEQRRAAAVDIIRRSVDNGIAAVAWDISGCEWGLITGYDDDTQTLFTLKTDGADDTVPYEKLGHLELPLLSVLTVTGKSDKTQEKIIADTLKIAARHLRGGEWCDNAIGLAAYDVITEFIREKMTDTWSLEYYLGTYAALRHYAWKFLAKYRREELAGLYGQSREAWLCALGLKKSWGNVATAAEREAVIARLEIAHEAERRALELMEATK